MHVFLHLQSPRIKTPPIPQVHCILSITALMSIIGMQEVHFRVPKIHDLHHHQPFNGIDIQIYVHWWWRFMTSISFWHVISQSKEREDIVTTTLLVSFQLIQFQFFSVRKHWSKGHFAKGETTRNPKKQPMETSMKLIWVPIGPPLVWEKGGIYHK